MFDDILALLFSKKNSKRKLFSRRKDELQRQREKRQEEEYQKELKKERKECRWKTKGSDDNVNHGS